jgi:hypothetical protein
VKIKNAYAGFFSNVNFNGSVLGHMLWQGL